MFLLSLVSKSNPQQRTSALAGFGLIELMVSIAIMTIVSSIILARQSSFNGAVLLRSQTYEVALAVREVQLSAISAASSGSGDFRSMHGIYFDTSTAGNARYRSFLDTDNDGFYDAGEEFGSQGRLDPRFEIDSITVQGAAFTGSQLSVVFERPNFDARFFSSSGNELTSATAATITVRRKGTTGTAVGDIKTVEITATGQIAVK